MNKEQQQVYSFAQHFVLEKHPPLLAKWHLGTIRWQFNTLNFSLYFEFETYVLQAFRLDHRIYASIMHEYYLGGEKQMELYYSQL